MVYDFCAKAGGVYHYLVSTELVTELSPIMMLQRKRRHFDRFHLSCENNSIDPIRMMYIEKLPRGDIH